jgi:hypothetical protein
MTADVVYVRGLGFRPGEGGLALAEPVTVTRDSEHALRVVRLVSTAQNGTELAFEMVDGPRERAARSGSADYQWHTRGVVELLGEEERRVSRVDGPGNVYSIGGYEFGTFRQDLRFERLSPNARRVTFTLRGELGDWELPLDLVSLSERAVVAETLSHAEQERHGITVRVRAIATTPTETVLDIEASAAAPVKRVVGIGAWPTRYEPGALLALADQHGRRLEEVTSDHWPRNIHDGAHTVATFPRLPADARELTLVVPRVIVEEAGRLDFDLPVYAPTEARFGSCSITIRWADVVDDLQPAPGSPPTRGVLVQVRPGPRDEARRALRPSTMIVDAIQRSCGFGVSPDPDGWAFNVPLPEGGSAKTVTLHDPVVQVRGPWEITWRR